MLLYNPPQSSGNTNEVKEKKKSLFIFVTKSDVSACKTTDQNVCRFPPTMHFSVKFQTNIPGWNTDKSHCEELLYFQDKLFLAAFQLPSLGFCRI